MKKIISISTLILGGGFIGTIMILAAQKSNKEDKIQLSDLTFFKGQLQGFHIDYKQSTSPPRLKYKFLALRLNGLNQTMGVYKPAQEYNDILSNIKIGDTVLIYYRQHSQHYDTFISGENFNSDIYQLSINDKTYIKADQKKSDHSKGNIAATIGGVFIYIVVIIAAILKARQK